MERVSNGPLSAAKATELVRSLVSTQTQFSWTHHVKVRLDERDLIMGDVMHVLRHGFVYEPGELSTMTGLFKYKMEAATPNSKGRTLVVVVIPSARTKSIKIVTAMWKDGE